MKICSTCKEEKDINSFSKNKSMKDGLHNQCKSCRNSSYKSPEAIKNSRYKTRVWNRWKWSGFTEEDFNNKLIEQDNKCAICGVENPNHADHNHTTKTKRGILCKKCNTGIAYLQENTNVLQNAINYLNHYSR